MKTFSGLKCDLLHSSLKSVCLAKFWPDLEILEAFLMGLEVSFSGDFCVSDLSLFFPYGLKEFNFRVHGYGLSN